MYPASGARRARVQLHSCFGVVKETGGTNSDSSSSFAVLSQSVLENPLSLQNLAREMKF